MPRNRLSLSGLSGQLRVLLELLRCGVIHLVRWLTYPSPGSAGSREVVIDAQLHGQPPLGGIRVGSDIRIVVELRIC